MPKRKLMSPSEIDAFEEDVEWVLEGPNGNGFVPAETVLDLIHTFKVLQDSVNSVYKELITLD